MFEKYLALLSHLCNSSFNQGKFLDTLKVTKAFPIFKDEREQLKVANTIMIDFLAYSNLYDHQFGF